LEINQDYKLCASKATVIMDMPTRTIGMKVSQMETLKIFSFWIRPLKMGPICRPEMLVRNWYMIWY